MYGMKHPKLFPTHFNLVLTAYENGALDELFEHDHLLRDENELIHKALAAGIKVMTEAAAKRRKAEDPQPTRTQLLARAAMKRPPRVPRQAENYIGFPLSERLRLRLEDFLEDCPGAMDEERAAAMLLDLGLQAAEGQAAEDLPADEVVEMGRRAARKRRACPSS